MHGDCAYRIGATHAVCQDYSMSGDVPTPEGGRTSVVLADGCSSSPDTDVGARLLVRAVQREVRLLPALSASAMEAALRKGTAAGNALRGPLGLPQEALDATVLAVAAEGDRWWAALWGDGVLAVGHADGTIGVLSVSYGGGCPEYPAYSLAPDRLAALRRHPANPRRLERWTLHPEQDACCESGCEEPPGAGPVMETGSVSNTRWVAVLSDGIHSFVRAVDTATSRTHEAVPFHEPLRELLAFRNGAGVFAQRRLQRFEQESARRGWRHLDDLTLAAVWMEAAG